MSGHGVKKETYVGANDETFRSLTYDMLDNISSNVLEFKEKHLDQVEKCHSRFKKVENRKLTDKGFAGAMGLIGGFIAGMFKGG
jgi:hypothetical protein